MEAGKPRKVRDDPVTLKRPATMENKRSSKETRVGRWFLWAARQLIAVPVAHRSSEAEFRMVSGWRRSLEGATLGDVSGVGFDQNGDILIFHRGGRPWLADPVQAGVRCEAAVWRLDGKAGRVKAVWGANTFLLAHGLCVDRRGHVWPTGVGRHQVFEYTADGVLLLSRA